MLPVLVLAVSEIDPVFRATGLGEINAALLRSLVASGRWSRVVVLAPACTPLPIAVPFECHLLPVGSPVAVTSSRRVVTPLPTAATAWAEFAEAGAAFLAALVATGVRVDVWAAGWPMADFLRRCSTLLVGTSRGRLVFGLDLVPPDSESHDLLVQAAAVADVVHFPSSYWRDRVGPRFAISPDRCAVVPYPFNVAEYDPSFASVVVRDEHWPIRKATAKRQLQERLGFDIDPKAFLMVFAGRCPVDDQKNFLSILAIADDLLASVEPRIQLVGTVLPPAFGSVLDRQFSRMASRYSRSFSNQCSLSWPQMLLASDLQLLPSRCDPFAINLPQGLVLGCLPCASSHVGCVGDDPIHPVCSVASGWTGSVFAFSWNEHQVLASLEDFLCAVRQAAQLYAQSPDEWSSLRMQGIHTGRELDSSRIVHRYLALFRN